MSIEIESADIIRLIQQFLKESNLPRTLQLLQEESSITLNTVDNIETFVKDVTDGKWDVVLKTISQLRIPHNKLIDLYEQIIIELIELGELGAARSLLRQTDPMQVLRDQDPDRYLHLEHILSRTYFNENEVYSEGQSKEKRRQQIAQGLMSEVSVVPPSRLLTLLGQALKYQQTQGLLPPDSSFDLFRGTVAMIKSEEDAITTRFYTTIKFPKRQHAECLVFSPNGQYLATGSVDGFIELWNYMNGKLRKDLVYQAEDRPMLMEHPVLCLAFSCDSELIASGDQEGKVKIWRVQTGKAIKAFNHTHTQGVTSVSFSKDSSQILTTGFDQTIRIHGLKSGKMLKEFRGHSSFVNSACFSNDESQIISGGSDGTIRIWDVKSTGCLHSVTLQDGQTVQGIVGGPTVTKIIPFPKVADQFLVCNQSSLVYLISLNAQIIKTYNSTKDKVDNVDVAVSHGGIFVYSISHDMEVCCFDMNSCKRLNTFKACEKGEAIGLVHHPLSNIVAVNSDIGRILFWRS